MRTPRPPGALIPMTRHLILVLGDQLDPHSSALDGFDPATDAILQIEAREEATYIPQHKQRLAFFFSAMRHFRDEQRAQGREVIYTELNDPRNRGTLALELERTSQDRAPGKIIVAEPGDYRVRSNLEGLKLPLEVRPDRHFLCSSADFNDYADEHKQHLLLENFYRWMRRRLNILMEPDGSPVGGAWNFDAQNRATFGREKPTIPSPPKFKPDQTTRDVLAMVEREFPGSPGSCHGFDFAVTPDDARKALKHFVRHRPADFG